MVRANNYVNKNYRGKMKGKINHHTVVDNSLVDWDSKNGVWFNVTNKEKNSRILKAINNCKRYWRIIIPEMRYKR